MLRKGLQNLTNADIYLRSENGNTNNSFVNQSLCPYYRVLWSKSKKLHALGKIHSYFISIGTVKIKIRENGPSLSITHIEDFKDHFPEVDLSPSN